MDAEAMRARFRRLAAALDEDERELVRDWARPRATTDADFALAVAPADTSSTTGIHAIAPRPGARAPAE